MPKYRTLNVGDVKPKGYQYRWRRWRGDVDWQLGTCDGISRIKDTDIAVKEYRILIDEPEMKFKIGDEVEPVKMAKGDRLWLGGTISSWKSGNGSITGKVIEIEPESTTSEHFVIQVKNNGDNTIFFFREDELELVKSATAPTHPDAAELSPNLSHMSTIKVMIDNGRQYRILKPGDTKPKGYEYRNLKYDQGWKKGDGTGEIVTDTKTYEYRVEMTIDIDFPTRLEDTNNKLKEAPMVTAPETELEKLACDSAKKEAVEKAINAKKQIYQAEMAKYIELQSNIKVYQKQLDIWQKDSALYEANLGITEETKKQLF